MTYRSTGWRAGAAITAVEHTVAIFVAILRIADDGAQ
ncbi:hypothetical protein O203_08120 [Ectopseudomonas chengduensis]|nr:hypothetical protein O203_08120 [Pseudomonas chengduensis]